MALVDGTGAAAGGLGLVAAHHASGAATATAAASASHLHRERRRTGGTRLAAGPAWPEGPAAFLRRVPNLRGTLAGNLPRVFSDSGLDIISAG
jgi:hypothetical protein